MPKGLGGKRVMVTGGAGFVGRRVCERLQNAGVADVVVPRRRDFDLTDPAAVASAYDAAQPDLVIHLAAEVGGIGANRANPGRYFYANMAMGLHLVEAARRRSVGKFLQVGTVCSYPQAHADPVPRGDPPDSYPEETNAPYGIAKRALREMLQAYRRQYGLNGIYLMAVNLYGPHDDFDLETSHVIPALIRKFEEARLGGAKTGHVLGQRQPVASSLDDCADAIVLAAERYDGAEPVNVGSGDEITIRDLAEKVARHTGFEGEIEWDTSKPDGQPRRRLDTSRARDLFGFESTIGLDDGLERTIQWYRDEASTYSRGSGSLAAAR